jgi:hypothetical protein
MTKLAVAGIMATVYSLPAEAQTISVTVLDEAQIVLQAAIKKRPAAKWAVGNSGS